MSLPSCLYAPRQPGSGTASLPRTYANLIKAFIGPGILFFPRGFANAGLAAGVVTFVLIAGLSAISLAKLIESKERLMEDFDKGDFRGVVKSYKKGITYGLLGRVSMKRPGRWAVEISLFLSQLGFAGAAMIFMSKNLRHVVLNFSHCGTNINENYWILMFMPILMPLVWIRNLKKFAIPNLIAEVVIALGLSYIMVRNLVTIGEDGVPPLQQFESKTYWNFLGTTLYMLEGMALILPIHESMAQRKKCKQVTNVSILIISVLLLSFGALGYITYGADTSSVITLNMEAPGNYMIAIVQIGYCFALLISFPMYMIPPNRIAESRLFRNKRVNTSPYVLLYKNAVRSGLIALTAVLAIAGQKQFDNFVSLIGGIACVPLALIYPPYFHQKICGDRLTARETYVNYGIMAFGVFGCVAASVMSVVSWIEGGEAEVSNLCASVLDG